MKSFHFILMSIFLLLCASCNNDTQSNEKSEIEVNKPTDTALSTEQNIDTVKEKIEISKAILPFKKMHEKNIPYQTFQISSSKPQEIIGKKGTIIKINPSDLICVNGSEIGENLTIELVELSNQKEFLKSNVQTMSGGKLLESGGMYYVNISSGKNKVKLKDGKTMSVHFPKNTNKEMQLFYGQKDSLGNMNWTPTNQVLTTNTTRRLLDEDTTIIKKGRRLKQDIKSGEIELSKAEEYLTEDIWEEYTDTIDVKKSQSQETGLNTLIYEEMRINQLGWINIDKFVNSQFITMDFTIQSTADVDYLMIYFVYQNLNSVTSNFYKNNGVISIKNLPQGESVKMIAVSNKDNKYYAYESKFQFQNNQTKEIVLNEISEQGVKNLFK